MVTLASNLNDPQDIIVYHELIQLSGKKLLGGGGEASREARGKDGHCCGMVVEPENPIHQPRRLNDITANSS